MSDFDPATFASVEPREFVRLVKSTPDAKLAEAMRGDLRGPILDEVFNRMPGLFRAERAGSTNAVLHWNITGGADGGANCYEIVIENGTCHLSPTPRHEPKLTLTLGAVDFLKIVSGTGNPMMMFMTGKVKAKGDLGLATNIANLFHIPKGAGPPGQG